MNNSLKTKLEERKAAFALKADDNKKRAYRQGIDEVRVSGITTSAKQVGDVAPDFNLYNAESKLVSLSDILKEGPVILNWYRGGWCPYCNMTLQALQQELANYQSLGAQLIAITPELPDNSLTTLYSSLMMRSQACTIMPLHLMITMVTCPMSCLWRRHT